MNDTQERYIKRAIRNYGIDLTHNTVWFIDEGKIFYGIKEINGEISNYLSGHIWRNTFVIEYSTQKEILDIEQWYKFVTDTLELNYIDTRH